MKLKKYALLGLIALINLIPGELLADQQENKDRSKHKHHQRHNKYACPAGTMHCSALKRCTTRKLCQENSYIELGTEYYLADR